MCPNSCSEWVCAVSVVCPPAVVVCKSSDQEFNNWRCVLNLRSKIRAGIFKCSSKQKMSSNKISTIQQLKLKTPQVLSLVGNLVLLMAPHFAFPLVSQHGYQVISNNYEVTTTERNPRRTPSQGWLMVLMASDIGLFLAARTSSRYFAENHNLCKPPFWLQFVPLFFTFDLYPGCCCFRGWSRMQSTSSSRVSLHLLLYLVLSPLYSTSGICSSKIIVFYVHLFWRVL